MHFPDKIKMFLSLITVMLFITFLLYHQNKPATATKLVETIIQEDTIKTKLIITTTEENYIKNKLITTTIGDDKIKKKLVETTIEKDDIKINNNHDWRR